MNKYVWNLCIPFCQVKKNQFDLLWCSMRKPPGNQNHPKFLFLNKFSKDTYTNKQNERTEDF